VQRHHFSSRFTVDCDEIHLLFGMIGQKFKGQLAPANDDCELWGDNNGLGTIKLRGEHNNRVWCESRHI